MHHYTTPKALYTRVFVGVELKFECRLVTSLGAGGVGSLRLRPPLVDPSTAVPSRPPRLLCWVLDLFIYQSHKTLFPLSLYSPMMRRAHRTIIMAVLAQLDQGASLRPKPGGVRQNFHLFFDPLRFFLPGLESSRLRQKVKET